VASKRKTVDKYTAINGQTGIERPFFSETNPTTAFVGAKVAPLLRVVWVCAIDVTTLAQAPASQVYAIRIDHEGGSELMRRFALPVPFFCNDLALDLQGNVYVTDSLGDAVLRIRPRALSDASLGAEVFVRDPLLAGNANSAGLPTGMNGVAVTPDNLNLIVARGMPAQLLTIPLAHPSNIAVVSLAGDTFAQLPLGNSAAMFNPDGIVFVRGKLYVVFAAGVQEITFSGARYLRGDVRTTVAVPFGLSTATAAYGQLFVIDSEIHVLSGDPTLPIVLPHSIVRVPFESFGP
jgi:sugar lactone lactonase YvrE